MVDLNASSTSSATSTEEHKIMHHLQKEIGNLETTRHATLLELQEKKNELELCQRQISEAKAELSKQEKEIFEKRQELNQIVDDKQVATNDLRQIYNDLTTAKKRLEDFEIEVQRITNYLQKLEADNEMLEKQNDNLERSSKEFMGNIDDLKMKKDLALKGLSQLQDELNSLEQERKALNEKLATLQQDESKLQSEVRQNQEERDNLIKLINNYQLERNRQKDEQELIASELLKNQEKKRTLEEDLMKLLSEKAEVSARLGRDQEALKTASMELQQALTKTEEAKLEARELQGQIISAKDQIRAIDEGLRKNRKIYETSEKETQRMLADRGSVEFEIQSLESKRSMLSKALDEMSRTKERKFEEMTQFKIRAEKDLELMRQQTDEKKRQYQAFANEIEAMEKKQLSLKRSIEELELERSHAAESFKRQKNDVLKELQDTKNRILVEMKQLQDHRFQTDKAREKRQQVELQLAESEGKLKFVQAKIDNFEKEREDQLKKLGEVKAAAEYDAESRRKLLINKIEVELDERKRQLSSELEKKAVEQRQQLEKLKQQEEASLKMRIEALEQQFKDKQISQLNEVAERVQAIIKDHLAKHDKATFNLDLKSIIRDSFAGTASISQITKKAILIHRIKTGRRWLIAGLATGLIALTGMIFILISWLQATK